MPIKLEQNIHQGYGMQTLDDVGKWINITHNNLIAAGLLQTADTGQVVSVTGTTATLATNVLHGYRVYELNDAFSGVVPVYIRLDFRTISTLSSSTFRYGFLTVTVGFSTNGAGALSNSQVSRVLKSFLLTNSGATAILNPNARTMTVKGDDFLFHGNELCAGYLSSSNLYEGGFFAIVRCKLNDVVDPARVTFIFQNPAPNSVQARPVSYVQLLKDGGISSENSHIFRLPRIRNEQSLLVASEADISENGLLIGTDRLICFRALSDDTPWITHKLSVDGLTEKTYLHLPMSPANSTAIPTSVEKLYLSALVDIAEPAVGGIGILIDE